MCPWSVHWDTFFFFVLQLGGMRQTGFLCHVLCHGLHPQDQALTSRDLQNQDPHRLSSFNSFFYFILIFGARVSLCGPGWPGTCYGTKVAHRDPPAPVTRVLRLKAGTTMTTDLFLSWLSQVFSQSDGNLTNTVINKNVLNEWMFYKH